MSLATPLKIKYKIKKYDFFPQKFHGKYDKNSVVQFSGPPYRNSLKRVYLIFFNCKKSFAI